MYAYRRTRTAGREKERNFLEKYDDEYDTMKELRKRREREREGGRSINVAFNNIRLFGYEL